MNPIGAGQAYSPTTVSIQAPIGKAPVGLESPQNKNATLPPIEESAAADKVRAERTAERSTEHSAAEHSAELAPALAVTRASSNAQQQAAQLVVQAQPDLPKLRSSPQSPADRQRATKAVRAFDEVQRDQSETPSRVDQRV